MYAVHVQRVRVTVVAFVAALVAAFVAGSLLGGCASGQGQAPDRAAPEPSAPAATAPGTAGGQGSPGSEGEGQRSGTDSNGGSSAVDKTISVRVVDGDVRPAPGRVEVERGARVRIEVTSDQPDELHVHGYDETARLRAGEPARVQFVADQTGLFEVETHHGGLTLFQLLVR